MQSITSREDAYVRGLRQTRRIVLFFAWILVATGLGIGLYGVYLTIVPAYSLSEIGEFVGGTAGSLWALAGLFFIYAAFVGQQEELVYQRVELRSTRQALQLQRTDLAEQQCLQNEQARKQIFESMFFQLLRLHSDIVHRIRYEDVDVQFVDGTRPQSDRLSGREAFRSFYGRYDQSYRQWAKIITSRPDYAHASSDPKDVLRDDLEDAIVQSYDDFYVDVQSDLGHYFRNLYHMVKFVDSSSAEINERESYMSFIRAQLSSYELLLMFYKCLTDHGRRNFKPLIEKYALLENMPTDRLIDGRHKELYSGDAFGDDA
jgi:hypothetical protein